MPSPSSISPLYLPYISPISPLYMRRCELKMPVLDAITLVDFFHSAVTDYPVFGLNVAETKTIHKN